MGICLARLCKRECNECTSGSCTPTAPGKIHQPSVFFLSQLPTNRKQSFVHRDNDDFGTELEHTPTIIISDQEDAWASPSMVETKHNEQPQMSEKSAQVNVFDYEVTDFDDEKNPNQEMQERGSASLRGNGGVYNTAAPEEPDADSQWNHMDEEDTNAHIEHAK